MNPHVVAGCAYLVLNTLLPWAVLVGLWRRVGEARRFILLAAVVAPAVSFLFGGTWFAVADWLTQELPAVPGTGYGLAGGFVLAGLLSVFFLAPGSLVVLLVAAVWQRLAPASFDRLTRRNP